jgi:phage terminase large subunit-like protein
VAGGPRDPTTAYARKVVAGKILAGRLVRLACERHLRDLQHGELRGLHFDVEEAQAAIDFFGLLTLPETEGEPFDLEPFQQFIVGSLFGWMGPDGYRRFRIAYVEIGKGNGKSPLAGGIGLRGLVADEERGAQVYSAATTRDQAKIVFSDAEQMAQGSPALARRLVFTVNNIAHPESNSFFRPVSSEARGLDGKRVHIALIDELHEHPSALVVDKMRAGTKGRRQALIFEITNSGYDRNSVCYQHHDYSVKVLEGVLENDAWFAYVCQLDPCEACRNEGKTQPSDDCGECDDWRDEATWEKANPCLDVSVTRKYLREQVTEAEGMPGKENIVRRLNFCQWTEQAQRWLSMELWDANGSTPRRLNGRRCWAGMDLASSDDIAAFVMVFPGFEGEEEYFDLLCKFWIPQDNIQKRVRKDRVPYDVWVRQGLITATEGDVIDYDTIRADINGLSELYQIEEIAFDRWGALDITAKLTQDGFTVVPHGQGFGSMAAPTKEFGTAVKRRRLRHGGNPVLRWMASNTAVETNAAGDQKPSKERSTEKIDGIPAAIMGLGRAVIAPKKKKSVYATRGLQSL